MPLQVQYRMHPAIAAFPSRAAYGGELVTGIRAEDRPPVEGFPWPMRGCPVAFVGVGGVREELETVGNILGHLWITFGHFWSRTRALCTRARSSHVLDITV